MQSQHHHDDLPEDIDVVVIPRSHDLGDNFVVRRALPSTERRMVGPFVFLDEMGPHRFSQGKGLDVRPHPHIGLATVTYLLDGESCTATASAPCSRSAPVKSTG